MRQERCLFCPSTKLSGEHLWPAWICKLYGADQYAHTVVNARDGWQHERMRNSITHKFACVCARCNNGWMSEIENRASSVLRPMIGGRFPTKFGRHAQHTIAVWLSLRLIIFDAYSAAKIEDEFFSINDRSNFSTHRDKPLPATRVWLGRMTSDWQGASFSVKGGGHTLTKALGVSIATCVVGNLALQIFAAKGQWDSLIVNREEL